MTGTPLDVLFVQKAVEAIASVVITSVWSGGGGLFKRTRLDESVRQKIFDASHKYVENYTERHGILKVLGMREPIWLESVYTAVQFLSNEEIRRFESIENLEEAYRQAQSRRFQGDKKEKRDGLEIANAQQYLMVLGQPGAGKSTFLRRMGLEALKGRKGKYQHECIPVFIELKQFITNEVNLDTVVVNELKTCGFPKPEESARKLLEQGKLLLLLDGLDEVPTAQQNLVITQIQDFVDRHDKNRFIASCRTAAYRSSFRRFGDVIMADFDDAQIQNFITNWFSSEQDRKLGTAQKCWLLLQQPDYQATRELAQTPLLLTFLCLVFDDSQTFPKNRAVLYGEALDVLLKKWAAEKRIQRDPIYQDLSIALEEMMLAEIAFKNFISNHLFFSQREVVEQIRKFLAENLNAPKHLDGEDILNAIQLQQGILVERATDVLSFSHLTLQEYLTAQWVADHNQIKPLVSKHLTDKNWREVFLLVTGLLRGGADELLLYMEAESRKLITTNRLKYFVSWATQVTTSTISKYQFDVRRAAAIYFALSLSLYDELSQDFDFCYELARYQARAFIRSREPIFARILDNDRSRALTRPLTHNLVINLDIYRALDIAIVLVMQLQQVLEGVEIFEPQKLSISIEKLKALKNEISSNDQSWEICQSLAAKAQSLWYETMSLNPEFTDLSLDELKFLSQYLYANELIVRCKEAAVRVSPQVWEQIEARMLTVN